MALIGMRGQAAVTDTVYFLLIVSGLCVFLFGFANQYGAMVSEEVTRQYYVDFATSALKTVLYSSTPRDTTQDLYDPDAEIDHLFAYVKEDYADDSKLTDATEHVMAENVIRAMAPIADSFDYLFYIFRPAEGMIFVQLHASKFSTTGEGGYVEVESGETKDYLCAPDSVSETKISKLINIAGNVYLSSSKIVLEAQDTAFGQDCTTDPCPEGETCDAATHRCGIAGQMREIGAEADLVMWPATQLPVAIFDPSSWQCTEIG